MNSVSLEDFIFGACAMIGLLLAATALLLREQLGDLLERFRVDVESRGAPVAGVLAGFFLLFGVGGLIAVHVLGVHGGFAVLAGMLAGFAGAAVGSAVTAYVRGSEIAGTPSMRDLVGRPASVAVAIPAGRFGSVYVKAEGRTHEYSATASADIAAGATVTVTGAVGDGLVVAAVEARREARVLSDEEQPVAPE